MELFGLIFAAYTENLISGQKVRTGKMTASDLRSIRLAARDTRFIDIDEKKEPLRKEELSVTSADLPEALFACMNEVCK